MQNSLIICFLILILTSHAASQITNVTTKVNAEQDKVTITYDLGRDARAFDIKVRITMDGEVVTLRGLTGDFGPQVIPGLGKKIIWDVHTDVTELMPGELKVDVYTFTKTTGGDFSPPCPMKVIPAYAGLGGVGLSGIGLVASGLTLENNSKTLYDVYKTTTNPDDPVYQDLSRQEHYNEANKKLNQGIGLMVAGGTAIVIGGAVIINRLVKIKRYNKNCDDKMGKVPEWRFQPSVVGIGHVTYPGFAIVRHF
jgi:hypothetical protein